MKAVTLPSSLALVSLLSFSNVAPAQEHPEHPKKKKAAPAQEHPKKQEHPKGHEHPKGAEHPGHAPADDPATQAWTKAMTPGPQHAMLAKMVGTWDATVTVMMEPGKPPEVSTGVMTYSMALGGRWLVENYQGTFMGQPFTGIGYVGYDNAGGKYLSTWMDSMSTSLMYSEGAMNAAGTVLTSTGTSTDPMTGKPAQARTVWTVMDDDRQTFEMFGPGPDGKEAKIMRIDYTRRK